MNLLLDTHSFLWFIGGNTNLSPTARSLIEDTSNQPFLSLASLWEIAIKSSLGKLTLAQPFEVLMPRQMELNGIKPLNIELDDLALVAKLPLHHRDPFDRLLVAQAIERQIPVISADMAFEFYGVQRLW